MLRPALLCSLLIKQPFTLYPNKHRPKGLFTRTAKVTVFVSGTFDLLTLCVNRKIGLY